MTRQERIDATVATGRMMTVTLSGGLFVIAAVAALFPRSDGGSFIMRTSLFIGLAGLVALVAGWRLFAIQRERRHDRDVESACADYQRALLLSLSITEGAAMLGVTWYYLGGGPLVLSGVMTHMLLVGALWPTAEKLEAFVGLRSS